MSFELFFKVLEGSLIWAISHSHRIFTQLLHIYKLVYHYAQLVENIWIYWILLQSLIPVQSLWSFRNGFTILRFVSIILVVIRPACIESVGKAWCCAHYRRCYTSSTSVYFLEAAGHRYSLQVDITVDERLRNNALIFRRIPITNLKVFSLTFDLICF